MERGAEESSELRVPFAAIDSSECGGHPQFPMAPQPVPAGAPVPSNGPRCGIQDSTDVEFCSPGWWHYELDLEAEGNQPPWQSQTQPRACFGTGGWLLMINFGN